MKYSYVIKTDSINYLKDIPNSMCWGCSTILNKAHTFSNAIEADNVIQASSKMGWNTTGWQIIKILIQEHIL